MTRILVAGGVAALSVAVVVGQTSQPTSTSRPASSPVARPQTAAQAPAPVKPVAPTSCEDAAKSRALVDQVLCHLPQRAARRPADLVLDRTSWISRISPITPSSAEKVVRKLRAGMMPPTGVRRPDPATLESLIRWMETELDRNAVTHLPAPGLHRLNRTEYANAIRDLLALEVDATKFLPPDDSTRGFDNIAGALTMSPALMEAYLSAAGKISRLAIGDVTAPTQAVFDVAAGHGAEPSHRRAAVRHARRHADQAPVPGRRRLHVQGEGRHRLLPGGARRHQGRAARGHRSTASA